MGWGVAFGAVAKLFDFLSWPSFTLVFPLYASVQVMKSGSFARSQQCLSYWVLFAIITILELELPKLFTWFSFWPYAKGVATLLLVIPYFGGASYIYNHFIRASFTEYSSTQNLLLIEKKDFILNVQNVICDAVDGNSVKDGPEESEDSIYQGKLGPIHENAKTSGSKEVQKQWSCALCLVSTTSEKCLKKHLLGKKHKSSEEEFMVDFRIKKTKGKSSVNAKETSRGVLLGNINHIARVSFEKWSSLIGPVARSIRWCTWEMPNVGWTKLNTDGSIGQETARFGGLLRDHEGNPICAFVSKASWDDIFLVELWAIWRGLVLASGLGIRVLWIESDSMSVVKTINREQHYRPKASRCLKHVWKLLEKFEKYKVTHSWRETNRAADYLAKMALQGSDVVLWPAEFPDGLCNIIKNDAEGKMYRRA